MSKASAPDDQGRGLSGPAPDGGHGVEGATGTTATSRVGEAKPQDIADQPTAVAGADGTPTPPAGPEHEVTADRLVGRVLANRYRIDRRLGSGGFGCVFAAEDTKIHKQVAVKLLTRDLLADTAILTRFRQEAEAASKVGHENIVDITDFDRTIDGHYFMVMEYLDGVDLARIIRSGQQLPPARIMSIMIQVCRALNSAHSKGVVHRDLKPSNIFLTARGSRADFVKLLDFGISKFMEVDDESSRLTKTGQIIGTPLYMAPEQACGEDGVDHRVDVYSLGVIIYELVTGQPPFTAVNYLGIIAQHASDPPVPPSKLRPDLEIPPALEALILKAMAKRPEDRFSTMAEFEFALLQALATVDPASAVTWSPDRTPPSILTAHTGLSQRRLRSSVALPVWALLGIAVLLGIGAALYASWPGSTPRVATAPDLGRPRAVRAMLPEAGARTAEAGVPASAPVEARKVVLTIRSKPEGAQVLGPDGRVLGKTPLEHEVTASEHELELTLKRPGFRPTVLKLVPTESMVREVVLKRRYAGGLPDDPKGWGQR